MLYRKIPTSGEELPVIGLGTWQTFERSSPALVEVLRRFSAGGGRVIVPTGTCLTGPIRLVSNLDFHLEVGATLLFSNNFDDYPIGGFAPLPERHQSLITIANGCKSATKDVTRSMTGLLVDVDGLQTHPHPE